MVRRCLLALLFVSAAPAQDSVTAWVQELHRTRDDADVAIVAKIAGVRIGMIHDGGRRIGRAERLAGAFPGCDAVVYGHTHVPEVSRHGALWILNPGSPTERRSASHRSLLALEIGPEGVRPRLVEVA
jgi:predicted phosphodiesterase